MRMDKPGIVIVGLGPAGANLLTREAWEWLNSLSEVYLRTAFCPCVGELPAGLEVHSFDDVYEQEESLAAVLEEISQRVLQLGRQPRGNLRRAWQPMGGRRYHCADFRRSQRRRLAGTCDRRDELCGTRVRCFGN